MNDLIRRQRATEKTLAKYRDRGLDWTSADCIRMLRSHLVAMGHKGLPTLPPYRSATGAIRALKRTGYPDLGALIDSVLPRIAPAQMLLGDIALMEAEDSPFDAVTISVGGKVFGWHEEADGPVVIVPHQYKAAWRA